MPEDEVTQGEQHPQNAAEGPSKTAKVDTTAGGDDIALGGNQFDRERNKWVNKTPTERDGKGRFQALRESLERSQKKTSYIQALQSGAVDPTEEMSPNEWAAARNAQLRNRTAGIEMPELPADQAGENAEGLDAPIPEETISPEHERLCNGLIARSEDPAVQGLNQAIGLAKEAGAQPKFHYDLARFASEHPNGEKVLLHLGEHPEKLVHFFEAAVQAPNPREQLRHLVDALSERLSTAETARTVHVKPKPPDPVSTRASSSAFDVNDESIDADSWARQRNEQLAKRGRR